MKIREKVVAAGLSTGLHHANLVATMITVECHVGVLLELRFVERTTATQAAEFVLQTRAAVSRIAAKTKRRVVICTDLRPSHVLAPEVGDYIINLMRADNPFVERNGAVGNGTALLYMQIARLFTEADATGKRRIFPEAGPLRTWLGESLNRDERARLEAFLGQSVTAASHV